MLDKSLLNIVFSRYVIYHSANKMALGLSVVLQRTTHVYLHSLKIVFGLKMNQFVLESLRDLITLWNAKISEKRFGGTRVSFILDLNYFKVNLFLFEMYFCIIHKLINYNFNAFVGLWCLLSHEKPDKNTIKQRNFGHFVFSAQNCLLSTIFQTNANENL